MNIRFSLNSKSTLITNSYTALLRQHLLKLLTHISLKKTCKCDGRINQISHKTFKIYIFYNNNFSDPCVKTHVHLESSRVYHVTSIFIKNNTMSHVFYNIIRL